jgi:nitroreductase
MEVYEAVTRRRSIRRYQNRPVPYDVLEKCADAGRLAPCGRNHQLCEYIIVDDAKLTPGMFDIVSVWGRQETPNEKPDLRRGPKAYIVILINSTLEAELGAPRRITTMDVGFAAENIILVAFEQGVGACPALMFQADKLRQFLNIPDSRDIALVVAMGYPDEAPVTEVATDSVKMWVDSQGVRHVPKRKLEDIAHRNKFA